VNRSRTVINNIEESDSTSKENYNIFSNVKSHVVQVTNLLINVTNKMSVLSSESNDVLTEIEKKIQVSEFYRQLFIIWP
jgi:hypothetical protein